MSEEKNIKKGKKISLIVIFSLIAVILVLLISYLVIFSKPKQIFNYSLNKFYTNFKKNLNDDELNMNAKIDMKFNLHSNLENVNNILEILNKFGLNYEYSINTKDKITKAYFDTSYNNKELLKINTSLTKNKAYVSLNNIYDKTIVFDVDDEVDFDFKKQVDNMDTILKNIKML